MLEQWVHTVESGLRDLGHQLWQLSARQQGREESERLAAQLRRRRTELTHARIELAAVKRRLHDNPTEATLLHARIETALREHRWERAYCRALELDQIRQSLVADREACPRLEQACWSLQFLICQLERRLARLQEPLDPS